MIQLIAAFILKDYSYVVVYENVDNSMGLFDRIMATWAARQGAMLLWALLQSTLTVFVLFYLNKPTESKSEKRTISTVLFFNGLITLFALSSRPSAFTTQEKTIDGLGLTPSLLNFWQQIHPPVAFLSYSAFIIPYAIALGYMLKDPEEEISERALWLVDFFMLIGWVFTTLFILAGSIWAYEVDWGGLWFFDPVQVSSLVLWVMASLYFHTKQLVNKNNPLILLMASFGWIGVAFAAFIVRGGLLEGPHQYAGTAQFVVFSLLLLGSVLGVVLSVQRSKEVVVPEWLFSLSKARNKVSLLTVWVLVLIVVINLTSITLQIIYSLLDFNLRDLTDYYRVVNGILLSILGILTILCEKDSIRLPQKIFMTLISIGFSISLLWSFFTLPEIRLLSYLIVLILGTVTFVQLGHTVYAIIAKSKARKIGLKLIHLIILLTLFSYAVTDPQTVSNTGFLTLNTPVEITDFDLILTLKEVNNGSLAEIKILVQNIDNSNLGTVHLTQGIYLGNPWSKGDWISQISRDIFIKLTEINQFLFFEQVNTVSITIKIVPGVNIFRANILFSTIVGILGIWLKWKTKSTVM
ncbi:MAG: cytochrome c biogenesis protein CcsA [Candidatus Kariarchaeaceae archaeon]|jgi:cytochrome c-type biogenesis protein CcmF